MTRSEKEVIIDSMTTAFKASHAVIVCDYNGMGVSDLETLRKLARSQDANVRIVKNSLASIALKNAGIEGFELKDMNVFIWGDDAISTSKSVYDFSKKSEIFSIKNSIIDGNVGGAEQVEAFAKLPNREELLGMLASVWMGPVRNFTIGLDALKRKKEEEA